MNAPFFRPAMSFARTSMMVPLAEWLADPDPDVESIIARSSEPNSFAEPWFLAASVNNLDHPTDVRMLSIYDEGQLIGLMPVFDAANYGRMPVRHLENWLHYNSFYGAPLVRRGFESFFWARALDLLDGDDASPAFVHIVGLDAALPLARSLLRARRGAAVVHRTQRAMLQSDLDPQSYYEATVRKKKRKEIGRLRSRLNELGIVDFRRLSTRDDIADWAESFLTLEASGWKGRDADGSALARNAGTAAFLREAATGAFDAGRLEILRLDLDGRAIAMLVNFLCPPGSYSFKIAFDEDFARFSPGVLIQLENLEILRRADIDWMDSCAVEGHPMIESLWAERRDIVRISVPLEGWRRRATFAACRTLENASAVARSLR